MNTAVKFRMPAVSTDLGRVDRYQVRMARSSEEIASALRLRHEVFNIELGGGVETKDGPRMEFDAYDFRCRHLIVVDQVSGQTVGTYRLNTIETVGDANGFYSSSEFSVRTLPREILTNGVEIGRACVLREHRNTKVLFKLWKGLLDFGARSGKRYFFGCCSIFTQDERMGTAAYHKLVREGHFHNEFCVTPLANGIDTSEASKAPVVELPTLFNMYLRIGAKVCGPPMIDRSFGTIDFFVVFDATQMNEKYRRLFA
ncbi:MAG: GNAT family N-acetyltransferase [Pyrinomonadaceae bacterium]